MAPRDGDEKFSPKETQRRFDAALRGARIAGHTPKEGIAPKRGKLARSDPDHPMPTDDSEALVEWGKRRR